MDDAGGILGNSRLSEKMEGGQPIFCGESGKRTPISHFLLAVRWQAVYIPATSCRDSSVVERLSYTQLVGGSNPSPCTKDFLFSTN